MSLRNEVAVRRFAAVAAAAVFLQPVFAASQQLTVHQVFDAAFRRLQSYPAPPYAVWTSTWRIREHPMGFYTGERNGVEVHRYAVRLSDGMENVSEPGSNGKLPPAIIEPQFLGPFAWSLRSSVHIAPAGAMVMRPDIEGLKTIATVVAIAQAPYSIALTKTGTIPVESVDGHTVYHLELTPRNAPLQHNLRDLWIDVHTYDLWRAHFTGTYRPTPDAPSSATDVMVDFRKVLGCWVITQAQWNWDDAPVSFFFDVTNNEIGLPPSLPDWLFDAAAYRRHQLAGEPDYLGDLLERMRAAASPAPSATPNG